MCVGRLRGSRLVWHGGSCGGGYVDASSLGLNELGFGLRFLSHHGWRAPRLSCTAVAVVCSSVEQLMAEFHLMKFHTHMRLHTLQSTPYGEADVCDSFSGGYTTKPMPATVISYNDASCGTTTTFVKRARTEAWLLVATTGSTKAAGSPFGRTTVLGRLREQLRPFYDKPLAPITTEDIQAGDPMDDICELVN